MKDQVLSIEQMQHLKELGVDTSKASMVLIITDPYGDILDWDEEIFGFNEEEKNLEYFDAETGNYDHSYRKDCGVFTLQDIIDLLPKEIYTEKNELATLKIYFPNDGYWEFSYMGFHKCMEFFIEENIIDAAYEMLCWCIKEGYIKTNNDK